MTFTLIFLLVVTCSKGHSTEKMTKYYKKTLCFSNSIYTIFARTHSEGMRKVKAKSNRNKMSKGIFGIHHVTAITGDAQKNIDFYANNLGLRFVKLTVNQDDPTSYHLYYGDELRASRYHSYFLSLAGCT